jgi:hypothetical protein
MNNTPSKILNKIKREQLSTPEGLREFLNNLELEHTQHTQETVRPTVDDVVSSSFDYDDIMHYLKIETQDHKPMDIDSRKTHRMAKWCRMFLIQKY